MEDADLDMDAVEAELATLDAHINAAMHRRLTLIRQVDASGRWAQQGAKSCAHWLSWRLNLAPGTAREQVRVANRLGELPTLDAELRDARLTYSQVRAITRVATAADVDRLVAMAKRATGAQLEKIVRGVRLGEREPSSGDRGLGRWLRERAMGDGTVRVEAQLHADEAALVMEAVRLARAMMRGELTDAADATDAEGPEPSYADALVRIAEEVAAGCLEQGSPDTSERAAGRTSRGGAEHSTLVVHLRPDHLHQGLSGESTNPAGEEATRDDVTGHDDGFGARELSAHELSALRDDDGGENSKRPARERGRSGDVSAGTPRSERGGHGRGATESTNAPSALQPSALQPPAAQPPAAQPWAAQARAPRRRAAPARAPEPRTSHSRAAQLRTCPPSTVRSDAIAERGAAERADRDDARDSPRGGWSAQLDDGALLSPDAFRRLTCDCGVVAVLEDERGDALDVGRKTRKIPPALRRAVRLRDGGCRFPGCTHDRFVDAHHVVHWSRGGPTAKWNLVSLCTFHHRAVHDGEASVERGASGQFVFRDADGRALPSVHRPLPGPRGPELVQALLGEQRELALDYETAFPGWDGTRPDYDACVSAVVSARARCS